MNRLKNIPEEMKALPHWVAAKGKIPYDAKTGRAAKVNVPATWCTFAEAVQALQETDGNGKPRYTGVGFMFSNSGLVGIDIDKCVIDGKLTEKARDIVEMLDSYTEISTSGTGLHIIMKGYVPGDRNRKDGVEMYDKNRFFVMTGSVLERADQEGEGHD